MNAIIRLWMLSDYKKENTATIYVLNIHGFKNWITRPLGLCPQ